MTVDQLPQEFVKVSKHRNTLSFTTADMVRGEEGGLGMEGGERRDVGRGEKGEEMRARG